MRVILTRPDSVLTVITPPMGLGYLAQAVKDRRGDEAMIIDGRLLRLSLGDHLKRVLDLQPGAVGVTSMTFEAPQALALIDAIKKERPEIPVIMGGPHATGYGPTLLEKCRADYLVLGEGEAALTGILDSIEGKKNIEDVKGVVRRADGGPVFSGPPDREEDMGALGVDWEGIGPERYFSWWRRNAMNTVARSHRRLPVFFSRGCPYGCAYCHHIFGRKYRAFPVKSRIEEMVKLRDRYGVREFEIIDDTFNLKLDHAKEVMREIAAARLGASLAFTNGLRADKMDEELLTLMIAAGVYRIDYAVETASPRIQKSIHKNLDLARAREVIEMTAARRIVTGAYYILGFPTETREEMETTVDYALTLKNHISSFFYLMPFPGTEIAEADPDVSRRVREMSIGDASGIALNLSAATDREMRALKQSAYRRFYLSPARVMRIARDAPWNLRLAASAVDALLLSSRENVNY